MSDDGLMTIGTKERLEALETYARKCSVELARLAGGGSELFTKIGDEFYAEPVICAARVENKLMKLRQWAQSGRHRR